MLIVTIFFCVRLKMSELLKIQQGKRKVLLPKSRELTQIIHRVNSNDESS